MLDSNDDVRSYDMARAVLDGEYLWMEEGIVGLQENLSLPDYVGSTPPASGEIRDTSSEKERISPGP